MTSRYLHQYPDRDLPPAQLHQELAKVRHADCTHADCEMTRYCWHRLVELGHRPRGACTVPGCTG